MRFTILDGTTAPSPLDGWLATVASGLAARGHVVQHLPLRDMRICQCRGCFGCWVRTPGRCAIRDDGERVLREFLAADVAVLASPITLGFTSSLLRRAVERLLPQLHPYFEVVQGEIHHRQRYSRHPRLALLHGHVGVDAEDRELLALLHRRMAVNMASPLAAVLSSDRSPQEVTDALARA